MRFAMKMMDESVTVTTEEQCAFAERLMAMGRRLQSRASGVGSVVEGEVVTFLNGENAVYHREQ